MQEHLYSDAGKHSGSSLTPALLPEGQDKLLIFFHRKTPIEQKEEILSALSYEKTHPNQNFWIQKQAQQ